MIIFVIIEILINIINAGVAAGAAGVVAPHTCSPHTCIAGEYSPANACAELGSTPQQSVSSGGGAGRARDGTARKCQRSIRIACPCPRAHVGPPHCLLRSGVGMKPDYRSLAYAGGAGPPSASGRCPPETILWPPPWPPCVRRPRARPSPATPSSCNAQSPLLGDCESTQSTPCATTNVC